jgi:hypothetical protein
MGSNPHDVRAITYNLERLGGNDMNPYLRRAVLVATSAALLIGVAPWQSNATLCSTTCQDLAPPVVRNTGIVPDDVWAVLDELDLTIDRVRDRVGYIDAPGHEVPVTVNALEYAISKLPTREGDRGGLPSGDNLINRVTSLRVVNLDTGEIVYTAKLPG